MTKIYLLDPRTEIFQSFQDFSQLHAFANRSTRNWNGRILVIHNDNKSKVYNLQNETPSEILALTLKLQAEITK